MRAVFVGGSRKLARLNQVIRGRLSSIVEKGLWVFVGDANGADKALQQFFASQQYDRVLVYCMDGRHRNNIGHWRTKSVQSPLGARGFDYYSVKDVAMAQDASYGLMLWDGNSRGTLNNIRNMLAHGKPVAVYLSKSRQFRDLTRDQDLSALSGAETLKSERTAGGESQQELPLQPRRRRRGAA